MTDFAGLLAATADVEPPFAVVDVAALRANADDLVRRAGGRPIRVASKSVRCRAVLRSVLATPGFAGVLAYTLPEALWLAGDGLDDVVVGYPSVDRAALRQLASGPSVATVTLMVDSVEHLDLIAATVPDGPPLRVCLDLDASWRPLRGVHVGVRRSPVHDVDGLRALAAEVLTRPRFRLVGVMSYEAQIAGLGDRGGLRGAVVHRMQRRSADELARRRTAAVDAVRALTPLEFVNGGGTGSLERTAAEPAVTELAAGSGLYGPGLFDGYRGFRPRPAAVFALPVVRRPAPGIVTVAGGGWIASGPPGPDRVPIPVHPPGLRLLGTEGAGEVQTPLHGRAADTLLVGDRVLLRHAKAGELCEHVEHLHLVDGGHLVDTVPTYRGEHRTF